MVELKGCAYMKKGLRIFAVLVILLLMTACAEHPVDTHISSTPPGSTSSAPTVSVPKPTSSVPKPTFTIPTPTVNGTVPDFEDPCSKGHTFPENADTCSVCGVDYFSATLVFQPNSTRNGYAVASVGTCDRAEITIPAQYNGLPVTEIGEQAFVMCDWITKCYLPDSVTKIGSAAFAVCTAMTEVRLSENLTHIDFEAFSGCSALTEIVIPEKVTYLGSEAFLSCHSLQSVALPDSITEIGAAAFAYCTSLKSIYIPKNITVIPEDFASSCVSLERVEFGGEIISIGLCAFTNCQSLKTIDLGDKLERIGESAFASSALEEIALPDSVNWIDGQAFDGCKSLRKISIPGGLEKLGNQITEGCDKLEYTIYQGMQYLGNAENPYMILVGRSDSTQKHLIVHDDTRFIPENEAFSGSDIQSIHIGKSVECIYGWSEKGNRTGMPFGNMDALEKIEVSPDNKTYSSSGNCLIETATKTLVQGCKNSVIPDDGSVTIIGASAFANVKGLTAIVIPNSVVELASQTFKNCVDLEIIVIGTGVKTIGGNLLSGCKKIQSVYYNGTEAQWEAIDIAGKNATGMFVADNSTLFKTDIYFYSETAPTEPGNYWHYVDGIPTPWKSEE